MELVQMKCAACRGGEPTLTDAEITELNPQVPQWSIVEREGIKRLERVFKFENFAKALTFANKVGELAEAGAPSSDNDRVGQGDCHVVDTQDPWPASQ